MLVFPGVHARLSNLDSKGRWLKREEFEVARQKMFMRRGSLPKL